MAKEQANKNQAGQAKEPVKNIAEPILADPGPMTVEEIRRMFPGQVAQIKAELVLELNALPVETIRKEMPDLCARIAGEIAGASAANLNEKGFLLSQTDPFAAGTLRTYAQLTKQSGLRTPYVLPFKDKNTKTALQGYIIRAEGGGDMERGKAAREALKKCV